MSLQQTKPVHVESKSHYATAGGEVQVPWIVICEWPKAEHGDWYTDL